MKGVTTTPLMRSFSLTGLDSRTMFPRLARVLIVVVQPLDPASRFGAWLQFLVTIATAGALVFVPFGLANTDWTWTKAGVVALATFAVLSLRAAYRLQADRDATLARTPLQDLIVSRLKEGEELQRRLKRKTGDELPRSLAKAVFDWGGGTVIQLDELASDVGGDIYQNIGVTPLSMSRREATDYMRQSLAALRKLARELRA
jgi:hypothetical protein